MSGEPLLDDESRDLSVVFERDSVQSVLNRLRYIVGVRAGRLKRFAEFRPFSSIGLRPSPASDNQELDRSDDLLNLERGGAVLYASFEVDRSSRSVRTARDRSGTLSPRTSLRNWVAGNLKELLNYHPSTRLVRKNPAC